MRVAVLSHMYPSRQRPLNGTFIHEHVKSLREAGLQVKVFSPVPWVPKFASAIKSKWSNYRAMAEEETRHEEVPVRRFAYPTPPAPLHFLGSFGMARTLAARWWELLGSGRFDLLHAHTVTPDGYAACWAARRFGIPTVCSARGSEIHTAPRQSAVFRRLCRWTLRHADRAIAVSAALAREAAGIAGDGVHVDVIYNGVDPIFAPAADATATRARLGLPADALVMTFVGRCEYDKGLGDLLEAFANLGPGADRLMLVIVGNGQARQALEQRVQESGIGGRVRFLGSLGRREIAEQLQASDFFVLPSHGEGMPNALLEAMAVGLPSIATRVGGIPELVDDGRNGLLVDAQSPTALASTIRRMVGDPAAARLMGAAARADILRRFTWAENASRHLKLYRETLNTWKKSS